MIKLVSQAKLRISQTFIVEILMEIENDHMHIENNIYVLIT